MKRPEEALQKSIVELWQIVGRQDVKMNCDLHGMLSSPFKRGIAKSLGAYKGWPDLQFVDEKGRVYFLELKVEKRKLTDDQVQFQEFCLKHGIPHFVGRSLEDAKTFWRFHGLLKNIRQSQK